jgi:predicted Zn-ribbon and HTH transcriptional regulator
MFAEEATVGYIVEPTCRACGHRWDNELIGGTMLVGVYRCDRCGKGDGVGIEDLQRAGLYPLRSPWNLNRRDARKVLGLCTCGGAFAADAPVRCPKCGSDEVDVGGPTMMVD